MKILHVINSLGYGGAERQLAALTTAVSEPQIEQAVLTLRRAGNPVPLADSVRWVNAGAGRFSWMMSPFYLWRELRNSPNMAVVAWMYHSWLVALIITGLSGRRSRLFLYGRHADLKSLKLTTRIVAISSLFIARRMRVPIVFNSHDAAANHARWIDAQHVSVIPNGFKFSNDDAVVTRARQNRIGFLGRNHPDKGSDLLPCLVATIMAQLPDWEFVLAGPGIERLRHKVIKRMVLKGLDPSRVQVLGTQNCSRSFMASIDVLLLPSRTESFPNVLVEAITSGLLVAATSVGDINRVLDGRLQTVEGPEQIADLAIGLCRLPERERRSLVSGLLGSVRQRYGWDAVLQQHLQLWRGNPR